MRFSGDGKLAMMLKSSMVAATTAALSLVVIPLPLSPVPVTGQTLGVSLAGLLLGPWWGGAAMAIYLAAGVLGFPVFSKGGSGLAAILGPTGGYLLAFAPAAWATGILAYRRARPGKASPVLSASPNSPSGSRTAAPQKPLVSSVGQNPIGRLIAAALVGSALIHLIGSAWLSWQTKRTFPEALAVGSLPFLPGDVLKIILASVIANRYRRVYR